MVPLSQTSLPTWAHAPCVEEPDLGGASFRLLGIGPASRPVLDGWETLVRAADRARPATRPVTRHELPDAAAACATLRAVLPTERVGVRVLVAGTVQDCLDVRAAAVVAGLADDELGFGVVEGAERTVWCVHCSATTTAAFSLEDVVACTGCARSLLVHPHVSRRTGHLLGFMVDAEDQPWVPREVDA